MSLSLRALVAVGGIGGGVLVPWSLSKFRSNGTDTTTSTQAPTASSSAVSESSGLEGEGDTRSSHQQLPDGNSERDLEVPPKDPVVHTQELEVKEEVEAGNCTLLEITEGDIDDWFWSSGKDINPYFAFICEGSISNPIIKSNDGWGGLFPEKVLSTMKSSLEGKKFDIKMEVTPSEEGLNSYTVVFNGGKKFNSPVTGKWEGEEESSAEKNLKVISITSPVTDPDKIYIWAD